LCLLQLENNLFSHGELQMHTAHKLLAPPFQGFCSIT
jgi:hypothetical protein